MLAHPFLIGLPLSKDVVGRAVGPSYFSEKVSAFASAGVGQHFPFHLIARYHNRAGRPTDIGSAISGSGATDGIAAFVFPLFPRILEERTVSGVRRSRYWPRARRNAFASWSGQDVPRPLQSMPSRRAITSAACIPRVSRPIPWVFP